MPFATSIQALIGPHTAQSSSNTQCGVDWVRNNVYIIGLNPSFAGPYLSSVNMLTGVEQAWEDTTTYHQSPGQPPVGVDANGDVYLSYSLINGGGLIQIDPTTLVQNTFGGTGASPPDGFPGILQCGLNNIPVSGTQFMLVSAIGGAFADLRYTIVYDEVTFAGRAEQFGPGIANSRAINCAGKSGSGLGFVAAGPSGSGDLQTVVLSKVSCATGGGWVIGDWPTQNTNITISTLVTLVPTDIDAGWTEIYPVGIITDQTDGNPMLMLQPAANVAGYLVKFDKSSGAIIWQATMPGPLAIYNNSLSFSIVTTQRLYLLFPTPNTVLTVNTNDGSLSSYSTNLAGLIVYGYQSSNDIRGGILCNVSYTEGAGSPTKLNSTPASFTGWSMLYVAPAPAPPPGNRRFLSQQGPVRTGAPSSSPVIPPTPPPPTPPPPVITDITSEADEPLITESGSNIITET